MTKATDIEMGRVLLSRARRAIELHLGAADRGTEDAPWLTDKGATFVTLMLNGELRGCIGSIRPQRALADDIDKNAVAAATTDPRFPPVRADELPHLEIQVSLLSEPEFLRFIDEHDLTTKLRPGTDGVILFSGCRSATFLPQVWEQLPEPESFLAALKRKAGLDPECEAKNLMAATYTVRKWSESMF